MNPPEPPVPPVPPPAPPPPTGALAENDKLRADIAKLERDLVEATTGGAKLQSQIDELRKKVEASAPGKKPPRESWFSKFKTAKAARRKAKS